MNIYRYNIRSERTIENSSNLTHLLVCVGAQRWAYTMPCLHTALCFHFQLLKECLCLNVIVFISLLFFSFVFWIYIIKEQKSKTMGPRRLIEVINCYWKRSTVSLFCQYVFSMVFSLDKRWRYYGSTQPTPTNVPAFPNAYPIKLSDS